MIRNAKLVGLRYPKKGDFVEAAFVCNDPNVEGYIAFSAPVYPSMLDKDVKLSVNNEYKIVYSGFAPNVKIHAVL